MWLLNVGGYAAAIDAPSSVSAAVFCGAGCSVGPRFTGDLNDPGLRSRCEPTGCDAVVPYGASAMFEYDIPSDVDVSNAILEIAAVRSNRNDIERKARKHANLCLTIRVNDQKIRTDKFELMLHADGSEPIDAWKIETTRIGMALKAGRPNTVHLDNYCPKDMRDFKSEMGTRSVFPAYILLKRVDVRL